MCRHAGAWVVGVVPAPNSIRPGLASEARDWAAWRVPGGRVLGACLAISGFGLVAYCNHLLARIGRGSIVPSDPTQRLVFVGPCRYSRNPAFVGYLVALVGMLPASGMAAHLADLAAFFFSLRLCVRREERDLLDRFGEEYGAYLRSVPPWLGVRRTLRRPRRR